MTNTSRDVEKRSVHGCWTCRLRKLKCDEARDSCRRCRQHGIPCAGYSQERPEWKDGGFKEAERLRAIKALVLVRKKRNLKSKQQVADPEAKLQLFPHAEVEHLADAEPCGPPSSQAILNVTSSLEQLQSIVEHESSPLGSSQLSEGLSIDDRANRRLGNADREAELLEHYFDHIFSLQFQHYAAKFSPEHWLLPLIQTIIPLRYAVLSISALHQHQLKQVATLDEPKDDGLHELQEHYGMALRQLRQFIDDFSITPSEASHVPIICCCVQLISFDLFQGGNRDWRTHLQAANGLVKNHEGSVMPGFRGEGQVSEDIASRFCTGALLWFDIISSATFASRPMLHDSHQILLRANSPSIDLRNIMGCENSIMVLIGEIATLHEWKMAQQSVGSLSTWHLVKKASGMLEALESEIGRLDPALHLESQDSHDGSARSSTTTTVFACAAVVYLQTVVCGCHRFVPEVRYATWRTIKAMRRIKTTDMGCLSRALVWPAVVTGCFALDTEIPLFRSFLSAGGDDALGFGNCRTAIDILETCWEHNLDPATADTDTWDWSRAMKHLGYRTLLV